MFLCEVSEKVGLFRCDTCGKEQRAYFCHKAKVTVTNTHYCSTRCSRAARAPGGKINDAMRATCFLRYGVENAFQSLEKRSKIRAALVERFGVDNPQKSAEVKERTKRTCVALYGVDNPAKSDIVRERVRSSHLARSPEQKAMSLEKRKLTNIQKHGVPFPMQSAAIKARFDFAKVAKKSHETKKARGRYGNVSLIEEEVLRTLQEIDPNVQHQVPVNRVWLIDFYVPSVNVYVQLDGVYWHGLDRPLEEIAKFRSSKDASILKKRARDVEQNEWFRENGMRLLRITDKDVRGWQREKNLREALRSMLGLTSTT